MRSLNELEKDFCRRILALDAAKIEDPNSFLNLTTVVTEFVGDVSIVINSEENSVIIKRLGGFVNGVLQVNIRENDSVIRTLVVAINLLILLEKEAYISLFHIIPAQRNVVFGPWVAQVEHSSSPMYDTTLMTKIIEYATKEIIISDEFRRFCNEGFIARDEQRFAQQIDRATTSASNSSISARNSSRSARNSTIALYISTSALLLSLLVNYNNHIESKKSVPKTIVVEHRQMDGLVSRLNSINNSIDSLRVNNLTRVAPSNPLSDPKKPRNR
ncbi:hypothetical protein SAMN04487995_0945 [Dyadobacter koreensis]|uniref:Uncharacterized protein n=1 Tax=Dyadobacter koreensis TaxID=408657 RepID=A0A1H6QZK8_9BACT|nr:hypothetical protein [Dyadobacter koreensis]SEI46434.1 hypothetical protein SAMN04487995_0945 [Dyadobacter koreensis]